MVKNTQDNDLKDNKLTNIDSVQVNRIPTSDNELANKQYIDDQLDKTQLLDLFEHSKTISRYMLERILIILLNVIKNKL